MEYVLALPQAAVKKKLYMKTPKGFELEIFTLSFTNEILFALNSL